MSKARDIVVLTVRLEASELLHCEGNFHAMADRHRRDGLVRSSGARPGTRKP
jgi:hypothetical protein